MVNRKNFGNLAHFKWNDPITWHNDRASPGLEPGLANHRNQAARTVTLPIAPPRQANKKLNNREIFSTVVLNRMDYYVTLSAAF